MESKDNQGSGYLYGWPGVSMYKAKSGQNILTLKPLQFDSKLLLEVNKYTSLFYSCYSLVGFEPGNHQVTALQTINAHYSQYLKKCTATIHLNAFCLTYISNYVLFKYR